MSAFMCNTADFATLATFAIEQGCGGTNNNGKPRTLARVANVLGAENARSVNHRYAHNADAQTEFVLLTGAQVMRAARAVSIVQIIKLADCVRYQSCECRDFETTPACALLAAISNAANKLLPTSSKEAYEFASWGLGAT